MAACDKKKVPFEIKDLDKKTNVELLKFFTGERDGFLQIGPKCYLLNKKYEEQAAEIYNLEIRPSDVFVNSFPRSGTTLTQELVWLVANDVNIEKALSVPLIERFPFLEKSVLINNSYYKEVVDLNKNNPQDLEILKQLNKTAKEVMESCPSPRFIKSHLPLSLLPPQLLDTAKMVFVARNPRDVVVSYYYLNKIFKFAGFDGDFKTYWRLLMNGLVQFSPFFEIVKEAWANKDHPNMLFMFYEDMVKDLPKAIERVSQFLGKKLSEDQSKRLCKHLSFDNFKNNESVNMKPFKNITRAKSGEESFIGKGKSGGWRSHFDEEMTRQADNWIADNLRDTDLRFPST